MNSTKEQRQRIYQLLKGDKDRKESLVFEATGDPSKLSTKDLDFDQANAIILTLGGRALKKESIWSNFNYKNQQHTYILSLCMQAGHSVKDPKYGKVADLKWLDKFLHKDSPVKKPLQKMSPAETSKVIVALENIVKWSNERKLQA